MRLLSGAPDLPKRRRAHESYTGVRLFTCLLLRAPLRRAQTVGITAESVMPDADLAANIAQSAAEPKSMTTADGTVVQQDLTALIAADRYLRSRAVARNPFAALRSRRVMFGRADGVNVASGAPLQPYPADEVPPR